MKRLLKPFASLRLTVTLLALTMVLVFAGTWAQVDQGIWQVQSRYFHSFFCFIHFQLFWKRPAIGQPGIPGGFPMLGGYSIIALLLINLLSAHYLRFKFNRKRIGVIAIHAGLILLLVGEVATSLLAHESRMQIDEGQTVNYTMDVRNVELAIVDPSAPDHDDVVAIGGKLLASHAADHSIIADSKLPFSIRVDAFYPNSNGVGPVQLQQMREANPSLVAATAGDGLKLAAVPTPLTNGTENNIDTPSAYITPIVDGKPLKTYMASTVELELDGNVIHLDNPQSIEVNGKTYLVQLRWKREYQPYSITLNKFSHDTFVGTDLDSNFASAIHLFDPGHGENRDVRIWMNHPLRYAGLTFYQSGFVKGTHQTILQIVHNPGWLIPYISCVLVGLGMIIHFGVVLIGFLRKQRVRVAQARANPQSFEPGKRYLLKPDNGGVVWPLITVTFAALCFVMLARPPKFDGPFDLTAFGNLPINFDGRVMPLDTLARNSLHILSGRDTFSVDKIAEPQPAIRWLADVFADHEQAAVAQVIRIDNPDVIGAIDLDRNRHLFSFNEIVAKEKEMNAQLQNLRFIPPKSYNAYQKALADLNNHLILIDRLSSIEKLFLIPPATDSGTWTTFDDAMNASQAGKLDANSPSMGALSNLATSLASYHQHSAQQFNGSVRNQLADFSLSLRDTASKVKTEALFNQAQPFISCMAMYVLVLILAALSWLIAPARMTLRRSAFAVLVLTMLVHTAALIARCYIQGRPPVTNLYSSAIFIAWAAALFCIFLELIYRNGIGSLAAAVIAFPSLLIAHYLSGMETGDTMKQLQAVLDTNIWLATHVVVITLGYTATFLAGIIAIVFVVGRAIGAFRDDEVRKNVSRMIYGVVCFAMLFSFVGTVLGGIWADQSWGRFWGWDPKENGAVLIVLWNAIVLHARWSGLVKERGVANLAIFGDVVTAWSWFGTNMLGVGLHSYGFMDSAVAWLVLFIVIQFVFITVGLLPSAKRKSQSVAVEIKSREPQYV